MVDLEPPVGGAAWHEPICDRGGAIVTTGSIDERGRGGDPRQLLTVADTADYLAMSRGAVYNLLRTGELRSIHIGRSRRIVLADLWDFVDERLVGV